MKNIVKIYVTALIVSLISSCQSDFLDTEPTDSISVKETFSTVDKAQAALSGIHRAMYSQYGSQDNCGESSLMMQRDMLGEDLVMTNSGNGWFNSMYKWESHRNISSRNCLFPYRFYYEITCNANMIIDNIDNAEGGDKEKIFIKAEAITYRAWCHFNLVQHYGKRYDSSTSNDNPGVPIMLGNSTEGLPRATVAEVYKQVITDLDAAEKLFKESEMDRDHKSHFNIDVVYGLKARVYLTMQNWTKAVEYSKKVQEGDYQLMNKEELYEGFNTVDLPEVIWGSEMIPDHNVYYYSFFAFMSCDFSSTNIRKNPKAINSKLYDEIPDSDYRKKLWSADPDNDPDFPDLPSKFSRYPYMNCKFKVAYAGSSVGDLLYMRLAEMILIEAEAYARDGLDTKAQDALYKLVFKRNPEYVKSTNTGDDLIEEIMIQRRIELWGEGFRYFDLKRTNTALDRTGANHKESLTSGVMEVPKGDKRWEYLIPKKEIDANDAINEEDQNPI